MVDFELIIKYFSGKARPEEAEQVEDFVQSTPERLAYFQSLYQSWLASGDAIYIRPDIQKEWEYFCSHNNLNSRKISLRIPAIAASIAIILGLVGYFLLFKPQAKMMVADARQVMDLSLPDQTKVQLEAGAELQYPKVFKEESRIVMLKGNAGFNVLPHPLQPFIIQLSHGLNIRVTGTEFSVKETEKEITVDLKKGSVLFYNQKDTLAVAAGETGVYLLSEKKFLLKTKIPESGSFLFQDESLKEVAEQLSAFFQVSVHFQNPDIANCRLSAGFDDKKIDQIIQIIAFTFNLEYKIEGKNIYFDGDACP